MRITRQQVRRVIREHTHEVISEETSAYNIALDLAGLIPGLGEFADAANVIDYARKGDYLFSAFSLISLVPTIGDAVGKGGKLATWFMKAFPKGSKLAGKHAPDAIKKIKNVKDLIRKNKSLIDKVFDEIEENEKFKDLEPHLSKIKEALNAFIGSDDLSVEQQVSENIIRELIQEQLEDEQQMYVQKVQKIFPTDVNQAIVLADTAGIGDTPEVMAMKGARNVIDDFLHDWDMEDDEEFPITPSYPYGESVDANAAQDRREDKNGVRTVKLHSYLSHSLPSTKDARPIIRMWVRAIYGYEKGPPYRKSEVQAAEDLAAWVGIDMPATASKRAKK